MPLTSTAHRSRLRSLLAPLPAGVAIAACATLPGHERATREECSAIVAVLSHLGEPVGKQPVSPIAVPADHFELRGARSGRRVLVADCPAIRSAMGPNRTWAGRSRNLLDVSGFSVPEMVDDRLLVRFGTLRFSAAYYLTLNPGGTWTVEEGDGLLNLIE